MTRLKYSKTVQSGMLVTKPVLTTTEGMVFVTINPQTLSYHITNFDSKQVVKSGQEKSLHKLKIAAKQSLEDMGVHFDEEVRQHRSKQVLEQVAAQQQQEVVNG